MREFYFLDNEERAVKNNFFRQSKRKTVNSRLKKKSKFIGQYLNSHIDI